MVGRTHGSLLLLPQYSEGGHPLSNSHTPGVASQSPALVSCGFLSWPCVMERGPSDWRSSTPLLSVLDFYTWQMYSQKGQLGAPCLHNAGSYSLPFFGGLIDQVQLLLWLTTHLSHVLLCSLQTLGELDSFL